MNQPAFGTQSTGARMMQSNKPERRNHSPEELREIVKKVHALRRVTKMTRFFTSGDIVELLKGLSTDDLIVIGEELNLRPREMPRSNQ